METQSVHTCIHTTDGVNVRCEYTHNQQARPTTHVPHVPSTTPYALNLWQRLSPSWVFTHPFTPMAGPGAISHLWRTFTAATLHSGRVRRCRFVRLHARSLPDTIQSSPRCTEVGNASNRVGPNSAGGSTCSQTHSVDCSKDGCPAELLPALLSMVHSGFRLQLHRAPVDPI